jgi:N-acetylglutamate synthase-like GNAT family acetyltransferase
MLRKIKSCLCLKCLAEIHSADYFAYKKPDEKEAEQITKLIERLKYKHNAKMLLRKPEFYLKNKTIIVKHLGKLVGVISIIIWDDASIEVVSHAIHPQYQKLGLGKILFEKIKRKLRYLKPEKIFLFTDQLGFYGKLGFIETDPAQFEQKIKDDCNTCHLGPNGPGFPPCPEVAMQYHGDLWKKKSEMRS